MWFLRLSNHETRRVRLPCACRENSKEQRRGCEGHAKAVEEKTLLKFRNPVALESGSQPGISQWFDNVSKV